MAKDKLSASEVQLLLNHYQKKLKKAEKKLQAAENKVSKLRKKVSRVLFLQQAKQEQEHEENDATAIEIEAPEQYKVAPDDNAQAVVLATNLPDAADDDALPKLEPIIQVKVSSRKTTPRKQPADVPAVLPPPKTEETPATQEQEPEQAAITIVKRPGRKKATEMEALRQAVLAEGINRPLSPSDWASFIVGVITAQKRPLLTKDIINAAQAEFNFADSEMVAEERSIAKALHNLSNKTNELVKYKEGKMRGFYYCLPQWLMPGGELKKTYYNRIPHTTTD